MTEHCPHWSAAEGDCTDPNCGPGVSCVREHKPRKADEHYRTPEALPPGWWVLPGILFGVLTWAAVIWLAAWWLT